MKNVKIGVIGAGGIARSVHIPNLSEIDGVEVVAICDLHEDKAKELAAKYGVKKNYAVYHDMLQQEEIDAVYVLVNPDCSFRVADDCMKAGFHVMVEKRWVSIPIRRTLSPEPPRPPVRPVQLP